MAKVSVFEAAGEGFRLIRREPKAVLVWSAVLFVLLGIPGALLMQGMGPVFMEMSQAAASGSAEEMLSAQARMFGFMPLMWLSGLVAYTVLTGAVLRAVITPDDRKYFYLRLSMAELWMVLSAVVGMILAYIALIVVMIVVMIVIFVPLGVAFGGGGGGSGGGFGAVLATAFLMPLIVAVGGGYFMLRFSMAPILSFNQREFRLFESWGLTRGNGWKLFGLAALISVAVLVVELVVLGIGFAGMAPNVAHLADNPNAALEFQAKVFAFYASPAMWLFVLIGGLVGGFWITLMLAPWARVYLMLQPEDLPSVFDATEPQVAGNLT